MKYIKTTCKICGKKMSRYIGSVKTHFKKYHKDIEIDKINDFIDLPALSYEDYYVRKIGNMKIAFELIRNSKIKAYKVVSKKFSLPFSYLNLIEKYGLLKAILIKNLKNKKISKSRKKLNVKYSSKEWFVRSYGKTIGLLKYENYKNKFKNRFSKDWFIKKYGDEIGLEKFNEFVDKSKNDLEGFIKRYGEIDGKLKYEEYCKKLSKNNYFTFGWWYKNYSKNFEVVKLVYRKSQQRNKKYYIKKYGEEEGLEKYKEWIIKCASHNKIKFSKISQELFENIISSGYFNRDICFFGNNNGEKNIGIFKPDFLYKNKIIEFKGCFWHAKEDIYPDENEILFPQNKTVKEIRDYDRTREQYLKSKCYDIYVVWEDEFLANKNKVKNDCINFLRGNLK